MNDLIFVPWELANCEGIIQGLFIVSGGNVCFEIRTKLGEVKKLITLQSNLWELYRCMTPKEEVGKKCRFQNGYLYYRKKED